MIIEVLLQLSLTALDECSVRVMDCFIPSSVKQTVRSNLLKYYVIKTREVNKCMLGSFQGGRRLSEESVKKQ